MNPSIETELNEFEFDKKSVEEIEKFFSKKILGHTRPSVNISPDGLFRARIITNTKYEELKTVKSIWYPNFKEIKRKYHRLNRCSNIGQNFFYSLLSYIIVSKYVDHLPLYRQIQMFKRDFGWQASQSTFCDWVNSCCQLLDPLYNKLKQKILSSDYVQADESPIKVFDKDKTRSSHQGYQWVYHSPLQKLVLFNYNKGRGQDGPKEILENYKGFLQCDGYKVYDNIGEKYQDITLVGCLVHARRKFFDAQDNDPDRAKHALQIFAKIYREEKEIQAQAKDDMSLKQELRQNKIAPLIKEIKTWIDKEKVSVLRIINVGKAMTYYLKQYHKLEAVMLDARLELDNNLIENTIRPLALGRKNYLFAGSHKAAQNSAMIYSFFGSCKINDVNPNEWLKDVLEKIPDYNIQNIEQLLPDQWKTNNT